MFHCLSNVPIYTSTLTSPNGLLKGEYSLYLTGGLCGRVDCHGGGGGGGIQSLSDR